MLPRLRRVEPALRRALAGPCRLPRGSRVLVALSGGADSTALVCGLRRIAHEFDLTLCAAHLHHGLRGADADGDLEFAGALCARLGVPFTAARWDARRRMRRRGLTGQAGLRTLRREYLARVARRFGAAAIATAHTADDQLETMLMRLLRGTGLPGLGGMSPRRGAWIKPLLGLARTEIERDLTRIGQPWRHDCSNDDRAYLRSRIRLDVVPTLVRALGRPGRAPARPGRAGSEGPEAMPAGFERSRALLSARAAAVAEEARAAERLLDRLSARKLRGVCLIQPGEIRLASREVSSYPLALRRALYRRLWRSLRASKGLTNRHLEALDRLVKSSNRLGRIDLPSGVWVERVRGWLVWAGPGSRNHKN